jgi:glycosyltransferase involved in cell wall biosynthesis
LTQPDIGIVAIGRNEGQRLKACLESLKQSGCPTAYVDSGSSDGSVELARSFGADVVELDMSIPFSAARARNAGAQLLQSSHPGLQYIQFLDGDCLLADDWLSKAKSFLESNADYVVVCGRRRERFRDASIYNRLIDLEWDTPIGEAKACGGDALIRVVAFNEVEGFNPGVIAGEEPEFCVRLRQHGWRVMRLDAEMTLHDAAMTRLGQWWKRAVRGGYAYALGSDLHGAAPERHWVRETRSTLFWGVFMPVLILILAWPTHGVALILAVGYPLLGYRVYRHMIQRQFTSNDAALYAFLCVLAKFPQAQGVTRFWWDKLRAKKSAIIEYKKASAI